MCQKHAGASLYSRGLNPATLLPTEADGEPHNCVAVVNDIAVLGLICRDAIAESRSAFTDQKIGSNCVRYAVVTQKQNHYQSISLHRQPSWLL